MVNGSLADVPATTNANLRRLFACRKVAVVGASTNNIYAMGLIRRVQAGAATELIGVNPRRDEVAGIPCVPSVDALPDDVDAAFIAVSASQVPAVLRDCHRAGIGGAVVVAAGFADSRLDADRGRQRELTAFGRATGMAICGPSCLGVANVNDGYYIFGSTAAGDVLKGRVALISQSGGTVSAIVRAATRRSIGFSHLISSGSEASLSTCDYLEYLIDDEATNVICLFLEQLPDSERFIRTARKAADAGKPIFCIKIGRSEQGARAAIGHTGALTGADTFYDTLLRETGAIRCWAVEEMMDRVGILARSRPAYWPQGRRVGIVTVSGGTGTILSDLCAVHGVEVPPLAPDEAAALSEEFPGRVRVENPVDVSTQLQRERPSVWSAAVRTLAESPGLDAVLVADLHPQPAERIRALDEIRRESGTPIALTAVSDGFDLLDDEAKDAASAAELPILGGGEPAVRALRSAAQAAEAHAHVRGHPDAWWSGTPLVEGVTAPGPEVIEDEATLRRCLGELGVAHPREQPFADPSSLARGLGGFTFPVAVKVMDRRVLHKAADGMMQLDVLDARAATRVAAELWGRFAEVHGPRPPRGLLVQEMAPPGRYELYVSVLRDDAHRPVVTVGRGGADVEAAADVVRRLAPVTAEEALQMLGALHSAARLAGADTEAAAHAISVIADVALRLREHVRMIEVNPIIVMDSGAGALVVDTVIEQSDAKGDAA